MDLMFKKIAKMFGKVAKTLVTCLLTSLSFSLYDPVHAEITPVETEIKFPIPKWTSAPAVQSDVAKTARKRMESIAFPKKNLNPGKPPIITNGLVVVKNGVIRYERYANGYK